jgi:predicted  nucleic acid-binding Zn-ribbon protein
MFDVIEKLLILQDRDRRIAQTREELARIGPQRTLLGTQTAGAQAAIEAAKQSVMRLESDRKKLELEAEAKKQLIERYANQQLQTRKNEEYRALSHEIETCQAAIAALEDQELEIMEQTDAAQKQVKAAAQTLGQTNQIAERELVSLAGAEENLRKDLAKLESNRAELASAVDDGVRSRYERLFKSKGGNVVVGVEHGACGGCHMRVPAQSLVLCRAAEEIVTCENCGRILYFVRGMDLTLGD